MIHSRTTKRHWVLPFALVSIWAVTALFPTDRAEADQIGTAIITVTGAVQAPNRSPFDPFDDALFKVLDVTFENARAFDRAALEALPQATLTVTYPGWPRAVALRGPRLVDILDAAQVDGETVLVRGIDGYAPEFKLSDIRNAGGQFVLAITADGKPLSVGGRGPAWLALPPGAYPEQSDDDAALVWAVFNIEVR